MRGGVDGSGSTDQRAACRVSLGATKVARDPLELEACDGIGLVILVDVSPTGS